ncbi:hypothetical protein D3C72_1924550 [compost metagenome]
MKSKNSSPLPMVVATMVWRRRAGEEGEGWEAGVFMCLLCVSGAQAAWARTAADARDSPLS